MLGPQAPASVKTSLAMQQTIQFLQLPSSSSSSRVSILCRSMAQLACRPLRLNSSALHQPAVSRQPIYSDPPTSHSLKFGGGEGRCALEGASARTHADGSAAAQQQQPCNAVSAITGQAKRHMQHAAGHVQPAQSSASDQGLQRSQAQQMQQRLSDLQLSSPSQGMQLIV